MFVVVLRSEQGWVAQTAWHYNFGVSSFSQGIVEQLDGNFFFCLSVTLSFCTFSNVFMLNICYFIKYHLVFSEPVFSLTAFSSNFLSGKLHCFAFLFHFCWFLVEINSFLYDLSFVNPNSWYFKLFDLPYKWQPLRQIDRWCLGKLFYLIIQFSNKFQNISPLLKFLIVINIYFHQQKLWILFCSFICWSNKYIWDNIYI